MTRDTYRGVVLGLIAGLLLAALLVVTVRASAPRPAQVPLRADEALPGRHSSWGGIGTWADRGAVVPRRPLSPSSVSQREAARPDEAQPTAKPSAASKHRQPASGALRGVASWFGAPTGTAAVGPALRAALGPHWRGMRVWVCAGTCVTVVLNDWCACRGRVIDLSAGSFARLAPLSAGLTVVTVSRL